MADTSAQQIIITELVNRGFLDAATATNSVARAQTEGRNALKALVEDRIISEEIVYQVVADAAGMVFVNPEEAQIDQSALDRLPGEWARKLHALPYAWDGNSLLIAVDDPMNVTVADDLRRMTRNDIILSLAAPAALMRKISQVYRADTEITELSAAAMGTEGLVGNGGEFVTVNADEAGSDAPIVRYVNVLIAQAVADRASDIHIEPSEHEVFVRYRIDGVLHVQQPVNVALLSSLVSRIKIMSNLDISERRVPQDGRMTITLNGRPVDLRVTTLPTVYGEKIVLRILDNASAPLELVDVGLSDYHLDVYKRHYHKPYGMILMTGPTGSGKSTTLYATLNTIRSDAVNIITVEDPVEYRISGINQVQINKKAGLTFATALRSILRADPDVVLVGEIRDPETARIAVEASLTGHLVLTTLHTNDASSAVTRLVEMGLEPFLVGSAVSLVVAQRLVRRLCDRCSEDFTPETEQLLAVNFPWEPGKPVPVLKKAKGCERCSGTGFRGRTAIHEMLEVTPQIERLANEGAHTDQIREAAVEHNDMRLMRQDGWEKVLAGVTTIEEVLRATA